MEKNLFKNTILIVDDTPENIDVLTGLLEDFKKKVAINGEKALKIALTDNPPDLVLLDIMMPEMDGYEVCRRLRADERTKDVPVIFLTAKTQKEDIIKGFEAGGQDYVTKPFDSRELMERVKTQLELKTQREILKNMNLVLEEKVEERTRELNEAKKELEVLDKAKTEFLTMLSHEIRTPLNGIIGGISLLKTFELPDETFEFINMLDESIQRMEVFSLKALDISQLRTRGKEILNISQTNLIPIVNECMTDLSDLCRAKNNEINIISSSNNINIAADSSFIKKCLINILENAISFSPEKEKVDIIITDQPIVVKCEIKDKGPGFSKKILENANKPFLVDIEHADQKPGLSLHFVQLVMQAHSGKIDFRNNSDKGASVLFEFLKK